MGGDLRGLRTAVARLFQLFPDLSGPRTGGVKVLLRVAFDLGSTASPRLDFISKPRQPVRQLRLIHRRRKVLAIEETLGLHRTSCTVGPLRHVEDHRMGMKLRCCIAIDRAGGVMLELGSDELACILGGMIAADPCLGIPLQLVQSSRDGGAVSLAHTVVASYKCGEGHGLRCGKGGMASMPPGAPRTNSGASARMS